MSIGERRLKGETSIDFVRIWHKSIVVTALLMVASLVLLVTQGLNFGIDFEGGVAWEVRAPGVSVEEARGALEPLGIGEVKIQVVGEDTLRVQAGTDAADEQAEVAAELASLAGVEVSDVSISEVGPSWGEEITQSAVRALVFFFLAILAYLSVRLEWRMAVGALVAVAHDILLSVGIYSLFQFEVTPATVISFLTILGYSIYDTIVVFDKVQENEARPTVRGRMSYPELMNLSMNQVLLRSVNTTVSSLIPVLCVLVIGSGIMGVSTLREFSLALAIGLTAGAYSSIFVAAPVVAWLKDREKGGRSGAARSPQARSSRRPSPAASAERRATPADDVADATTDVEVQRPSGPTSPTPRPRKKKRR